MQEKIKTIANSLAYQVLTLVFIKTFLVVISRKVFVLFLENRGIIYKQSLKKVWCIFKGVLIARTQI